MTGLEAGSFLVEHPPAHAAQWKWIISVVLTEWLGLTPIFHEHQEENIKISDGRNSLTLTCQFLTKDEIENPNEGHFPRLPLQKWSCPDALQKRPVREDLPILFGGSGFRIDQAGNIEIGLDIFGSAFFMLSRYEEIISNRFDRHLRYAGEGSFSVRAEILNTPLIDEYVEILKSAIKFVWPSLELRAQPGRKIVTCDVDEPFERWIRDPAYLAKGIAGALIRRRSLATAKRRFLNGILSPLGNYLYDPYWNFDWYMDVCERHNRRAQFYFITQDGPRDVDAAYSIESKRIQALLRDIHSRGHLIGLHGSYDSFADTGKLATERERLQSACERAGAHQEVHHSRQHYLRWNARITPDSQDSAGFKVDSTVGYADLPGFRCGTSRSFTMWSWKSMAPLKLRQQPLIVMEGTLLSGVYMNNSVDAENIFRTLSERALANGGDYTMLWHNSNLTTRGDRAMFEAVIS